jgi:hypothetical protein
MQALRRDDPPLWLQNPYWLSQHYRACVLWIDAQRRVFSDAGTTAATNGDGVQRWSTANYGTITLNEATNKPAFQTGTSLHPLYAITFDGSNDLLTASADPLVNSDNFTIFMVGVKGSAGPRVVRGGTTFSIAMTCDGSSVVLTSGGDAQYDAVGTIKAAGSRFVSCVRLEQNVDLRFYQNAIAPFPSATTSTPKTTLRTGATTVVLGHDGTTFYNGTIAELAVFSRALPLWEVDAIMTTLCAKHRLLR